MHEGPGLGLPFVAIGCGIVWRAPVPVTQRDNRVLTTDVRESGHAGHLPVRNRQVGISFGSVNEIGWADYVYRKCLRRRRCWQDAVSTIQVGIGNRENDSNSSILAEVARNWANAMRQRSGKCNNGAAGLRHAR